MAKSPKDKPAGEKRKAFLLRLPPDLDSELRSWAARDLRSLNAEIEFLLREALRRRNKSEDGAAPGKAP